MYILLGCLMLHLKNSPFQYFQCQSQALYISTSVPFSLSPLLSTPYPYKHKAWAFTSYSLFLLYKPDRSWSLHSKPHVSLSWVYKESVTSYMKDLPRSNGELSATLWFSESENHHPTLRVHTWPPAFMCKKYIAHMLQSHSPWWPC